MQEAVPIGNGKMLAILGLKIDEVNLITKRIKIMEKFVKWLMIMLMGRSSLVEIKNSIENLQSLLKEKKLRQYH